MSNDLPGTRTDGVSAFERIKHTDDDGREWWSARELGVLLEYGRWNELEAAIERAKDDCVKSGRLVEENFWETTKVSGKRGPAQKDYRLTAYACRLIVMTARTTGQNAAQARTYFSDKTEEAEHIEAEVLGLANELGEDNPLAEVAKRIVLRQELTEANKELIKMAEAAGVLTPRQRAFFFDAGYKGLYGGRNENAMHEHRGLAPREKISNWMGAMETMANLLRAAAAKKRLERNNPQTPARANKEHFEAGAGVRAYFVNELGIAPEDLPKPTKSYNQIVKEEAERIRLEEEDERGLWGQLSAGRDAGGTEGSED